MENENTILTSDFLHSVRESVEKKTAAPRFISQEAWAAVEIVGDDGPGTPTRFDGRDFPVVKDNKAKTITFEGTEAIGTEVAKAAERWIAPSGSGHWHRGEKSSLSRSR